MKFFRGAADRWCKFSAWVWGCKHCQKCGADFLLYYSSFMHLDPHQWKTSFSDWHRRSTSQLLRKPCSMRTPNSSADYPAASFAEKRLRRPAIIKAATTAHGGSERMIRIMSSATVPRLMLCNIQDGHGCYSDYLCQFKVNPCNLLPQTSGGFPYQRPVLPLWRRSIHIPNSIDMKPTLLIATQG